jgi:hypothetical protein
VSLHEQFPSEIAHKHFAHIKEPRCLAIKPDTGTAVRWQTIFGTAPTAVSLILQGAMADVDSEYQTIDTTTNTAGEARTVTGVQARFLRIKFSSSTGGSGLTAKLLV